MSKRKVMTEAEFELALMMYGGTCFGYGRGNTPKRRVDQQRQRIISAYRRALSRLRSLSTVERNRKLPSCGGFPAGRTA